MNFLANGGWCVLGMFMLIIPYIGFNLMLEGRNPEQYPAVRLISRICGIGIAIIFLIAIIRYDMWC